MAAGVLVATVAGCGPFRRGAGPDPAIIVFANQSLEQATVYIAAPGLDLRRIGTVFGGRTDTLTVPGDLATRGTSLNIVARLLARPELPQTGPVSISPGGRYSVTLPPDARLLSFLPAGS